MRRLTTALAVLGALACGPPPASEGGAPSQGSTGALRVVAWNVHDLFDEVDDPDHQDLVFGHAEVEAKLARVGAVLARLDADVVVLEEVEHRDLLLRLAEGPLAGRGYAAFLDEGFDPRGIDVGLLARVPVASLVSHLGDRAADGSPLFARDLAELHLATTPPLVVLGAHLASQVDPSAGPRRALQAERLREVASGLHRGAGSPVVLAVGDLNDEPGSRWLAGLLADHLWADLGRRLPGSESWTWGGGGACERLDYALLDRDDLDRVTAFHVASGADVEAASDHRPLVVDLWLGGRLAAMGGQPPDPDASAGEHRK